jgi:hypothetical protein
MNSTIDVLFLRRPKIDYISPPVCEVTFSSSSGPVIVLNPLTPLGFPTGLILGGVGGVFLFWNSYPGALCYSVYRSNTATGTYVIVAECIENPPLDLTPFGPGFYVVTAITPDGESPPSPPIHFFGAGTIVCPSIKLPYPNQNVFVNLDSVGTTLGPFTVDEGSLGGPVLYKWFKDEVFLTDTTNTTKASLDVVSIDVTDFGDYKLHLSNSVPACAVESVPIHLFCNPIAWWKLDEIGGLTNRVDSVQSISAAPFNTPSDSVGLINRAIFFNNAGLNQKIQTGSDTKLKNSGTGFTLTGWINMAAKDPSQEWDLQYSSFGVMSFSLTWLTNVLTLTLRDGSGTIKSTIIYPANFTIGAWYYYRSFYDPVNAVIGLQVNDSAIGTKTTVPANFVVPSFTSGTFFLGCANGTFSVKNDETGIFPVPISDAQSDFLWNNRVGKTYPF